jgi:hypothetical protein
MVRVPGRATFLGNDRYGRPSSQQVRAALPAEASVTARVRVENDGVVPTRLSFELRGQSSSFKVLGRHADGGTTPRLQPGESWTFRVRVVRRASAQPGDRFTLKVLTRSTAAPVRRDGVSLFVRAVR